MVSECPVIYVPNGFCPGMGVPIGLQIAAPSYDDIRVFRVAAAFERARPWKDTRPAL